MSNSKRSSRRGRRSPNQRRDRAADLWRAVPEPEPPQPIVRVNDPGALVNSLGSPPLRGHSSTAEHYLSAVAERAAGLAVALAASADLLAPPEDD
jgi:hypothetical protein